MMPARFYNSLTKKVEPLAVKYPGKVRIYNCGPTVYKRQHLGNWRRFLFADFLRRSLEFLGYEVREITNITDVGHLTDDELDQGEDKIEREAKKHRVTPQDIATKETAHFMADAKLLNIQASHQYPRASQHIKQMQELIKELLQRGHAYQTKSGVYFDVQSWPDYGRLSGNKLEDLAAGKRIAVRSEKKHPADFALWVIDNAATQKWDSPWGIGYPGWHIECSAMSWQYLGHDIDIHTGGEDNRFPHHENEIAQSEAATGQPFVRLWMHNRHLRLAGQKLAKRAGMQITLDTLIEKGFSPLTFRLLVFGSHYRKPLDFSWASLAGAQENLASLKNVLRRLREYGPLPKAGTPDGKVIDKFGQALADDLNTPRAFAILLNYVRSVNAALDADQDKRDYAKTAWVTLRAMDRVVGVFAVLAEELATSRLPASIKDMVEQREQYRKEDDFESADKLRKELERRGYHVEDTPSGSRVFKT